MCSFTLLPVAAARCKHSRTISHMTRRSLLGRRRPIVHGERVRKSEKCVCTGISTFPAGPFYLSHGAAGNQISLAQVRPKEEGQGEF